MSNANSVCGTVEADFPGSPDAKRIGCRCTAGCHDVDADGNPIYWINVECPMHGNPVPESVCYKDSARCIDNPSAPHCECCPLDVAPESPPPSFIMRQHATLMSVAAMASALLSAAMSYMPDL